LETLEEMAISGREIFIRHGGKRFGYIPCLNHCPEWQAALHTIIATELSGWHRPIPAELFS
ncbi:MAG: ferrochelatase, partial [Magnetococcales bacterium]|nr:ferrochelatase [Magnetococcales bacterium]